MTAQNLPTLPDPSPLLEELTKLEVTVENYPEICDCLIEVKANYKRLDEEEKQITDPLKLSLKRTKEWFARPKKVYEKMEQILKDLVSKHQATLQETKFAAVRQIASGSVDARNTLAFLAEAPQPPNIQTREIWDFEIVDRSQIPGQFWVVDESAIRAYPHKESGIPGVRFFKKQIVAVRT